MNGYNENERDEQLADEKKEPSYEETAGVAPQKKQKYISENETYGGKPTTLKGKISNFWYHHKWGTIVSCITVVLLAVLVVQLINRPDYDFKVIYAGGHKISRIQENGKASEHENILASLGRVGSNFDGNGEISVAVMDYYYLTDEELNKLSAEGKGDSIDYTKFADDRDKFHDSIMTGEVCLLFLSESLFDELYNESAFPNGALFYPLSGILSQTDAEGYEFYGDSDKAVKLHSLRFGELPGICDLPEDTVVCLRTQNNGAINRNEEEFLNAKTTIKKLFDYGY